MEINIDKSKRINTIQEEFQKQFPFLKIEFFKYCYSKEHGLYKKNILNGDLTIELVQKHECLEEIKINALMKVDELETKFAKSYGLSARVLPKLGENWLLPKDRKNITLSEHNQKIFRKTQNYLKSDT